MSKAQTLEVVGRALLFVLVIYGIILGFRADSTIGVIYCFLVITPAVTAVLHLVTGFQFNLAVVIAGYVAAHPGILGIAALAALIVISWALLAAWWKIVNMFSRM